MMSAAELASVVRRRAWVLLACVVVIAGTVYLYSQRQPPVYEASTLVEPEAEDRPFASDDRLTLRQSPGLVAVYAQTGRAVSATAVALGKPLSSVRSLRADFDARTGWVTLTATAGDERLAIEAANAYAEGLDKVMAEVWREHRADLIRRARLRRAALRDPLERDTLAQELRVLRSIELRGGALRVVESASAAHRQSPNPERNALLAAVLALLIAPALMLTVERLDRRISRVEALEPLLGAPVLASLALPSRVGESVDDDAAEAFRRLRDRLLHGGSAGSGRDVLLVADPLSAHHSAIVATGLARAFARAGSDVLLVDADMHRSPVARLLGLPQRPGLADALEAGGGELPHERPGGDGRLRVLPGGRADTWAADLLGSERAQSVLARLEGEHEVVIVHAPPLLLGSDALPLIARATAVIAVARIGETPRGAARRAAEIVRHAGGQVRGVVAIEAAGRRGRGRVRSRRAALRNPDYTASAS